MPSLPLFRAAAIAALILANAFFVAAEFALVSLRRTRVQQLIEERRSSARIVADLQANLDELLPAVQLGVTLASLTLGWLGEPFVARFLLPWLSVLPHAHFYGGVLSAVEQLRRPLRRQPGQLNADVRLRERVGDALMGSDRL